MWLKRSQEIVIIPLLKLFLLRTSITPPHPLFFFFFVFPLFSALYSFCPYHIPVNIPPLPNTSLKYHNARGDCLRMVLVQVMPHPSHIICSNRSSTVPRNLSHNYSFVQPINSSLTLILPLFDSFTYWLTCPNWLHTPILPLFTLSTTSRTLTYSLSLLSRPLTNDLTYTLL